MLKLLYFIGSMRHAIRTISDVNYWLPNNIIRCLKYTFVAVVLSRCRIRALLISYINDAFCMCNEKLFYVFFLKTNYIFLKRILLFLLFYRDIRYISSFSLQFFTCKIYHYMNNFTSSTSI